MTADPPGTVLVTGAAGYVGRQVVARLQAHHRVVGIDVRPGAPGADVRHLDVRDPALADLVAAEDVTHVVHLAAVLEGSGDRERDRSIDVGGTRNVVEACTAAGVRHLTVTSSGAAYGYHADNPVPLRETDPLRGNPEFPYAAHKREVEALLAAARRDHPALEQLVLRVGTVLGATADNLITALLERPVLPAIAGAPAPFVFVWDADLVEVVARGVSGSRAGVYNVAGDGAVPMAEVGRILGRPVAPIPAPVLTTALRAARAAGVARYGPEQVGFLRHRPVLDATALVEGFGYRPRLSSRQALRAFAAARAGAAGAVALVTGAGGALCGELARRLADGGAAVVATDLRAPTGIRGATAVAADLTDRAQVAALVADVETAHGRLDLLIHCAGITHRSPAATTDPDLLDRVMAVNWGAPVRLTQLALPLMGPGSAVVGLSSMAGWMPVPGRAAYGGSKAALWHFLEALRPELAGRDVDVLVVHPSFLDSVMADVAGGARPRSDVGHPMPVERIADLVVQGLRDRRRWIFPDRASRAASALWLLWPSLYQRLATRRFAAELEG